MIKPAIRAEHISKEYRRGRPRGDRDTFYELLAGMIRSPVKSLRRLGARTDERNRFWALQDVSFDVVPGEIVGIIGRNGAGKSTLLKILSRITTPTRGRIELRGRLASLLEVGTGFHPELSGRENIYLNATILGMSRKEIASQFDEIVDFSGVGEFLDTPVKRYSSGMYVRLAFSVAAHVQADVLLVDEVLAVGDAEFQKRCLGKMEEVASAGRTVLFVSHNLTAIRALCSRGILLEHGHLVVEASIDQVLDRYSGAGDCPTNERILTPHVSSRSEAYVSRIAVAAGDSVTSDRPIGTKPILIVIDVELPSPDNVDLFIHCYDDRQTMVFSSGSFFDARCDGTRRLAGTHQFTCEIPGFLLNDGVYALDVMLVRNRQEVFHSEPSVCRFRVEDDFPAIDGWHWRPKGVTRPNLRWRHALLKPHDVSEAEDHGEGSVAQVVTSHATRGRWSPSLPSVAAPRESN